MDYADLLKRAKEKLPEVISKSQRFQVPKVQGHVEGNRTIIINMFAILDLMGREPDHMLKYLQRELATAAWYEDKRLVFGRKLSSSMINDKVYKYAETYVLCEECGKPDTRLLTEEGKLIKKCTACGHKSAVITKI